MAHKKNTLPVAKAGGPVSTESKILNNGADKYAEEEKRYRAQSDARTLAEAEGIRRDKARMKEVKNHVKLITKACK